MTGSVLSVRGLNKRYGKRTVVKDVSLVVRKGEVVGLLGPNGAGKTTSFYMIVGLVRASAGDIRIDGQSVEHMPIHRRARLGLSYLPQEASIFRKLNVADNVRAVLELQRDRQGKPLARSEIERRLTVLLQDLRVEHLRDSPALSLSGGVGGGVKPWGKPAHKLPMMVLWGGPTDSCFGVIRFNVISKTLENELTRDGHFLLECVHNCGHAEPPNHRPGSL